MLAIGQSLFSALRCYSQALVPVPPTPSFAVENLPRKNPPHTLSLSDVVFTSQLERTLLLEAHVIGKADLANLPMIKPIYC